MSVAASQTSTQRLTAAARRKTPTEVSALTNSTSAPAPAAADGGADRKSQVSKAGSTTTVLRKRIDDMNVELEKERAAREAAQRELEQTAKELAALEKVLTLRRDA